MSENENNELLSQIEDLSVRLAENFYQTVNVLSSIVLFTEKYYDGSHSRFVSEKSALIAEELGFSPEDVMEVRIAAILHDLGKLGFSDTMLFKHSSEMSGPELKKYQLYPTLGMQLLKPNKNFDSIGRIIHQHREKLDGTGFPRHLKKDNIHPAAKIIIVVDYYHSHVYKRLKSRASTDTPSSPITSSSSYLDLTEDRYKVTMNYLNKKKGILFEKKVVEIFTEIIQFERRTLGKRAVTRIPVNKIEPGMIFAEDYYTSYGMLIAAKGEVTTKEMKKALIRFAESNEIPFKILMIQ